MNNLQLRSQPLFTGHMSVHKELTSCVLLILMPDDNFMKKAKICSRFGTIKNSIV